MNLPSLTTRQIVEVDRLMNEEYGISLIQMMENAGSNLARLAIRLLTKSLANKKMVVLCGGGHNGGGGMVAARHLHNHGVDVKIVLASAQEHMKEIPALQWNILQRIGIHEADYEDLSQADLILDALIGYGIQGNPRGGVADWIHKANQAGPPILSLDTPSGLDLTTGQPGVPCIRASATLTLALPKVGLLKENARNYVGNLYLADISVPPGLYIKLGLQVGPVFTQDTIVEM